MKKLRRKSIKHAKIAKTNLYLNFIFSLSTAISLKIKNKNVYGIATISTTKKKFIDMIYESEIFKDEIYLQKLQVNKRLSSLFSRRKSVVLAVQILVEKEKLIFTNKIPLLTE